MKEQDINIDKTIIAAQKIQEEEFWLTKLSEGFNKSCIPYDFTITAHNGVKYEYLNFSIGIEVFEGINKICDNSEIKLQFVLTTALFILLKKYTNDEIIALGTSIYKQEVDSNLINQLLILKTKIDDSKSLKDILLETRNVTIEAFKNQNYPLELIIKKLKLSYGKDDFYPFFDVALILNNLQYEKYLDNIKFNLLFSLTKEFNSISCKIRYNSILYKEDSIIELFSAFKRVLNSFVNDLYTPICEVNIISESDKKRILFEFNNSDRDHTYQNIIDAYSDKIGSVLNEPAVCCNNQTITYDVLEKKSNSLANYLNSIDVKSRVVAIHLDPSIDLIVATLGVLKAEGVFLLIDTKLPQERKRYMLKDSNAYKIISCTDSLGEEYFEKIIDIKTVLFEPFLLKKTDAKLCDIAYILYTSGTTGRPKGTIVRHKGLLNYILWAADFYIGNENIDFALVTSISFDLTLTSIFTPLVTRNAINIYYGKSSDELLKDIIIENKVGIIKLTPSHLKILNIIYKNLFNSNYKTNIKKIILGGEPVVIQDIIEFYNFFSKDIAIYNEYGPTETVVGSSIFEINSKIISTEKISIGKPIDNTQIYILNSSLKLQPIGGIGEIFIGGFGVALGYLNNQDLTNEKFIESPYCRGKMLYRTGDLGRWLPDGNIEFLGRKDNQVKIRGYRIELDEIQYQLSMHENIQEVHVIAKKTENYKCLVAYYVSENDNEIIGLKEYLSDKLPEYMIPSYFMQVNSFSLTLNGKIDKGALPDPKVKIRSGYEPPKTAEELLLAKIWAEVLDVGVIGVTESFFSVGGDSIKSIQISSKLRSEGHTVTVKDIFTYPTIRGLAQRLKENTTLADQSVIEGRSVPTPIQRRFFEDRNIRGKHHHNQSVMLNFAGGLTLLEVNKVFEKIVEHHDALRMVFREEGGGQIQHNLGKVPLQIEEHDLRKAPGAQVQLLSICNRLQSGFDLFRGPLIKLGLVHMHDGSRLLIVIHHLVVDTVSWRILFEDIDSLYRQVKGGTALELPQKTEAFLYWAKHLKAYMGSKAYKLARGYWASQQERGCQGIARDCPQGGGPICDSSYETFRLGRGDTLSLLTKANVPFGTQINDILLTAFMLGVNKAFGNGSLRIDLEGHGREEVCPGVDIGRTVGWFTSIYPVLLEVCVGSFGDTVKQVKEALRGVPNNGIDYMLYRYYEGGSGECQSPAQVKFNYLGQFDSDISKTVFEIAQEPQGDSSSRDEGRGYDWELSGLVRGGQLEMSLSYSDKQYGHGSIKALMGSFEESLVGLISYCASYGKKELTPSDMTYTGLTIAQLDVLQEKYELEDIYPLSPMQEGMLYHSLLSPGDGYYSGQTSFELVGALDAGLMERSLNDLVSRYGILRTIYLHEGFERPVQAVLKERQVEFSYIDIREECLTGPKEMVVKGHREEERLKPFDLGKDMLWRFKVLRTSDSTCSIIWGHHHILMDGWCMGVIINEFRDIYTQYLTGQGKKLDPVTPYSDYIKWLECQDKEGSGRYWRRYLEGYESLSGIPFKKGRPTDGGYDLQLWRFTLKPEQITHLNSVSREYGVTINTIIQCAWGLLLSRYNNTGDVVFGSVVSGRPPEIEGIGRMVGLFINTVPVRMGIKGTETVWELLKRAQEGAMDSEPHHYHPLSEIQQQSGLGQGLIDHLYVFENFLFNEGLEGQPGGQQGPYEIRGVEYSIQTNYDFGVYVIPYGKFEILFKYNGNRFEGCFVEKLGAHFENIIVSMASNPGQLVKEVPMLPQEQQGLMRGRFSVPLDGGQHVEPIQHMLERSFARYGPNCALEYNGTSYSYFELGSNADKVASAIVGRRVAEGSYIGVLCEDFQWLLSSILGILKARSVFVPIEVGLPDSRKASMVKQLGLKYIITDQGFQGSGAGFTDQGQGIEWFSVEGLGDQPPAEWGGYQLGDPVYVYFTSGTTGEPKGIVGRNKGLSHFVQWEMSEFKIDQTYRFSQFTNPGFDVFMRDTLVPLCSGGTICKPGEGDLESGEKISRWIDSQEINLVHCVPSFFKVFGCPDILDGGLFCNLKYILLAGEKILPSELLGWYEVYGDKIQLANIYGPTETTLAKGCYLISPSDAQRGFIPIKPIPGAQFLILGNNLGATPQGAVGEIYIRTPYGTAGYLQTGFNSPSFVVNPYNNDANDLLYKTGDQGKEHQDGEIEILGRLDNQVKIRGIRIELDDIKERILKFSGIVDSVVAFKQVNGSDKSICAYYVSGGQLDQESLREYLGLHLTRNMVPTYLMRIPEIPLSANGKVDKRALPEPNCEKVGGYVPATNEVEGQLIEIWSEILKLDKNKISITQSVFELGGHSLNIMQATNRINKVFGADITLKEMFEKRNIQNVADYLITVKQLSASPNEDDEVIEIKL